MIPRGQPFPTGRPVLIECPMCLAVGRHSTLAPMVVLALGPHERRDAIKPIFYRYRCLGVSGCDYSEVHIHLIRRRS